MTIAPLPDSPEVLDGIDREVDKIIRSNDGKLLDDLETMRIKYLNYFKIGTVVFLCSLIFGILFGGWIYHLYGEQKWLPRISLFLWIVLAIICFSPYMIYRNSAKTLLMPNLVRLFGDLKWFDDVHADNLIWNDIRSANLIDNFDYPITTDFICGNMKGIDINLAETELWLGTGKNSTQVFCGAAIHIRLQKPAPVILVLKPRQFELHLFQSSKMREVDIPSPDFSRIFCAYSDDQVLARTLLTPDVVERLTKLAALFENSNLGVSLRDDVLCLLAKGGGELIPESLFTSAYKLDGVHQVGRQLYLLSSLIETIMHDWKLNTATPYQVTGSTP